MTYKRYFEFCEKNELSPSDFKSLEKFFKEEKIKILEATEIGSYKGWKIKSLTNNKLGTVYYEAHFEKSPISGLITIRASKPEELKIKIDRSNLRKGAI